MFYRGRIHCAHDHQAYEEGKRPNACIGCRSCEAVCPQQIKISESMEDFTKKLMA
ncbi:4Fe-4S binding protein [Murimonas intestini]|uniref:4Fe-4S binding protein n=1 Tax=Murimonas intestini TaxID=1337051 RepID=UPI001FAA0035|nr:4Fe-4S dicluster domain-containing protein [Murimonas intestini]